MPLPGWADSLSLLWCSIIIEKEALKWRSLDRHQPFPLPLVPAKLPRPRVPGPLIAWTAPRTSSLCDAPHGEPPLVLHAYGP